MDDPIQFHLPDEERDDSPNIMNDPVFEPPKRRNTASSKFGSEGGFGGETCRICRSEATPDEPLFYPCKCNGSIKFVHQECLMEWLSHSHKKHCELCKTPFRFTKLYDANMPKTLPWTVFISRACLHIAELLMRICRIALVSAVWLIALPWLVRWSWRWMFWFADAGWAREAFMDKMQADYAASQASGQSAETTRLNYTASLSASLYATFEQLWGGTAPPEEGTQTGSPLELLTEALSTAFKNSTSPTTDTDPTFFWPRADASILSSWTYISELTPNDHLNRVILDVFEGQLITCVVITGFILVFLIREWVVQQQPHVNIVDNANNDLLERDRQQQERDMRRRRQADLLLQARDRLLVLQDESTDDAVIAGQDVQDLPEFEGWDALSSLIDSATNHLRAGMRDRIEMEYDMFYVSALSALQQVRAAESTNINVSELADKVYGKLAALSNTERQAWEEVLVEELKHIGNKRVGTATTAVDTKTDIDHTDDTIPRGSNSTRRPPMPNRGTSSRAAHIQRLLEETDSSRTSSDQQSAKQPSPSPSSSTAVEPGTPPGIVSAPSTDSWQQVSPPTEQDEVIDDHDIVLEINDEMPITNAGPDAKINIKRSAKTPANAKTLILPPEEVSQLLSEKELREKLDVLAVSANDRATASPSAESSTRNQVQPTSPTANPFHPDGPDLETGPPESFGDRVANEFREELGLDEAELSDDEWHVRPLTIDDFEDEEEAPAPEIHPNQVADAPQDFLRRLADWFWGDIQPQGATEPAVIPNEELLPGDEPNEAALGPVQIDLPAIEDVPLQHPIDENDPEVFAAAQQAGLDVEAVEDAEDLEGIFELIGLQGPLIGLFQTSCFCSVLVTSTVFGAVGLPYVWGKLVLSFIGAPWMFLVRAPLQAASFVADSVIDVTLMILGWLTIGVALMVDIIFSAAEKMISPALAKYNITDWITDVATNTASSAAQRLADAFAFTEPVVGHNLGWNWAFLSASVHAHSSLKTIQDEVSAVLNYTGNKITYVADTLSSGSATLMWERSISALARLADIPANFLASVETLEQYTRPILDIFSTLRSGALTFRSSQTTMDPSLVYWNTTDRGLAVLTGYIALALVAAVYVALDQPVTYSQAGQKTEKMVRDTLRQAGGVLKVILIISIEMLVFPLYCGLLLDLAFLPLFHMASVSTRWGFAMGAPYTFCFVHWFVGTCYMFHFALFVGMCRKILRKGVLWFIRDPDDPTFHPVRDVLERNVTTQLRKIAFSALVYGALVILCLGGVIWTIGRVFKGIFPIHWISTEPVLEFPLDLALYNFLTPVVLRLSNPSAAVNAVYAWWLRRCARVLRLSHFLFDDRRKDEEGRHVRKTWASFFLMRKGDPEDAVPPSTEQIAEDGQLPEVYFKRDGKYVLTPCSDQYRPPKPGEAYLHKDEEDLYITDKDGKKNDNFAKVYVPPLFRLRITLFMVCLWMFSAFAGLCATLVPLVFGRTIFTAILPHGTRINDIYSYSVGAYILGTTFLTLSKGSSVLQYLRKKARGIDIKAWVDQAVSNTTQAAKCVYVYGFTYVVIPLVFALLLQFYLVLPLHTYAVASLAPILEASKNSTVNATVVASALLRSPSTQLDPSHVPTLADHSIHILADYALCLIYLRIALRWTITSPTSRAAEAIRRITADGYLSPNVRLATRFFILPALIVSCFLIFTPPSLAKLFTFCLQLFANRPVDDLTKTLFYRYSYPMTAAALGIALTGMYLAKATGRWRASIRDEVYLVGERLHNFGEKKPPVGSKSVVRKDR